MPIGAYNPWVRFHCTPEQAWRMSQGSAGRAVLPGASFDVSTQPRTRIRAFGTSAHRGIVPGKPHHRSRDRGRVPPVLIRPCRSSVAKTSVRRSGCARFSQNLSIVVSEGERIGLIGPNGSGKSTLVSILAGVEKPDDGIVAFRKNVRVAYVPQESRFNSGETVRSVLNDALLPEEPDEYERESRMNVAAGRVGFDSA